MHAPQGFKVMNSNNEAKVWRLKKAVYGLKQSPHLWAQHVRTRLLQLGFKQSVFDSCCYQITLDNTTLFLCHHVDDFLLIGAAGKQLDNIMHSLKAAFTMKDLGQAKKFLNIQIIRNRPLKLIHLSQQHYAKEILQKFEMHQSKPLYNPLPDENVPDYDARDTFHSKLYLEMLGSLNYLSTWTRPDLAFTISKMSQFMMRHNEIHYKLLRNVFRYLNGTADYALELGGVNHAQGTLMAYSDADFAGDVTDRRSRTGSTIFLDKSLISWQSKKQSVVANSTAEAEYIALASTTQLVEWLSHLLDEMQGSSPSPIKILEDNQACIKLAQNTTDLRKIRHIEVKQHFIRNRVEVGAVTLEYCPTDRNVADLFTKAKGKKALMKFCSLMNLKPLKKSTEYADLHSRGSVTSHTLAESANVLIALHQKLCCLLPSN